MKEENATEEEMLDAFNKGYIKDWRDKKVVIAWMKNDPAMKLIVGMEFFHSHHWLW